MLEDWLGLGLAGGMDRVVKGPICISSMFHERDITMLNAGAHCQLPPLSALSLLPLKVNRPGSVSEEAPQDVVTAIHGVGYTHWRVTPGALQGASPHPNPPWPEKAREKKHPDPD